MNGSYLIPFTWNLRTVDAFLMHVLICLMNHCEHIVYDYEHLIWSSRDFCEKFVQHYDTMKGSAIILNWAAVIWVSQQRIIFENTSDLSFIM